ncbi:hypothetical protein ACLKA7_007598, partial [Drosophila subpalustris]
ESGVVSVVPIPCHSGNGLHRRRDQSLGERGHGLQPRPLRFYGLHRDRSEIVVCTRAPAAPALVISTARTVIPAVSLSGTFRFPVVPMVRTMAHEDS